jgi:hypothetical protein
MPFERLRSAKMATDKSIRAAVLDLSRRHHYFKTEIVVEIESSTCLRQKRADWT